MVLAAPITVYNRERSDKMTFGHLHELANEYFLALSLAHEVVSDTESTGKLRYQGPSTDEIALVEAAKAMGYEFISGTQSSSTICVQGELRTFVVLQVFPFTA